MCCISLWFIFEPEVFIRNVFMREWHIILLGVISMLYFLILFYSFLIILSRPFGIIIREEYFIDNSKYEAVGKIMWSEVSKIQSIKKSSIKIFLKIKDIDKLDNNLVKKFLRRMHNWDYKNSIVISSALLNCDINNLEEKFLKAYIEATS